MIITGYKKRSIAQQTGNVFFSFDASLAVTSGLSEFGLSGGAPFKFSLSGGKILDPNGNFVQSYYPDQSVNISGILSPNTFNYYINSNIIAFGQPTPTGVYSSPISYLYANTNNTLEISSLVRGEVPDYSLDEAGSYTVSGQLVSGRIINNASGRAFRIFDASINGQSSFAVSSFSTGDITNTGYIVFSGDGFYLQDQILPVVLQTNFGQIDYQFTISGDNSAVSDVYLNLSPDLNVAFSDRPLYINAAVAAFPSGTRVGVSLEYLSGTTGNIYYYSGATGSGSAQMSGYITGCGSLSYQTTGYVSGLDPKTAIWETGVGTGVFSSARICATGNVSGNYLIDIYGLGFGNIQSDYTASGAATGYYTGRVPFTGAVLNAVAYNYAGTGDSPTVATGTVPVGTGKIRVYPTGCIGLGSPIDSSNYYSANLSYSKVYSGPLSYQYSVMGVGYATGQSVSGTVTSSFLINFEPGQYTFSKYFSGVASGYGVVSTGIFDINKCPSTSGVSGLITGNFTSSHFIDCEREYPTILATGIPSQIYNADGTLAEPNRVYVFTPSGGFEGQTLANYQAGLDVKTSISRMGATPSGFGTFLNPIQSCAVADRNIYGYDVTGHYWRETISGVTSVQTGYDSLENGIGSVNTKLYITGTGDVLQDFSGVTDSGVMDFYISGSGAKAIALKGLNRGETDRILNLTLYKNGLLENSWENIYIPGYLYQYYNVALSGATDYDTVTLSELESGYYSLVVTAKTVQNPQVSFTAAEFSGCESSRNIIVTVQAQGVFRKPCCVDLKTYYEDTARSGVDFDPIYLVYGDAGLRNSGCVSVGAHAPRGARCPGICFDRSSPSNYGTWREETKIVEFRIPIYDNAVYGNNASFDIVLDNPSGCTISQSTATVVIVDNDNKRFITGESSFIGGFTATGQFPISGEFVSTGHHNITGGFPITGEFTVTGRYPDVNQFVSSGSLLGFGVMPAISIDCSLVPDLPPEPPPECIFNPLECDPCYQNPESCISGRTPPCECGNVQVECLPCAGGSVQMVSGVCNGQDVSGLFGIPGASCGTLSTSGCGPTSGIYIYIGSIPTSGGARPVFEFNGNCLSYETLLIDRGCGMAIFECTGSTGECPQTVTWSGCVGDGGAELPDGTVVMGNTCWGASDNGKRIEFGRGEPVCPNYASGYHLETPACGADLFLKVSSTETCNHHSHGCHSWNFTGRTVFPPGNPQRILCDALL